MRSSFCLWSNWERKASVHRQTVEWCCQEYSNDFFSLSYIWEGLATKGGGGAHHGQQVKAFKCSIVQRPQVTLSPLSTSSRSHWSKVSLFLLYRDHKILQAACTSAVLHLSFNLNNSFFWYNSINRYNNIHYNKHLLIYQRDPSHPEYLILLEQRFFIPSNKLSPLIYVPLVNIVPSSIILDGKIIQYFCGKNFSATDFPDE